MLARQPFARRIVVAFVLMTAVVSGLFSLSIVGIVHFVEGEIVSEEMHSQLHEILRTDLSGNQAAYLGPKTRFYAEDLPAYAIPERFTGMPAGFTEVVDDEHAFYVFVDVIDGRRYLLVEEQHEFEASERALYGAVLAGFIGAVLAAWGLGWLLARKIMEPVSRLAGQVQHIDQLLPAAPPMAAQYPDDEVGQLAAAFDSTLGQLRQSLERERLFTSDVSHELRTPLMVVATSCELLQQAALPARQQAQVARIERANEEIRSLVQIFLQLARGKSTDGEAALAGLAAVAAQQSQHWAVAMAAKGLSFTCLSEGTDGGRYNPTLLGSVIANLLRNALHYTEHGHVSLILECGAFRVEDSGAGVARDEQEAIFQPFVRGQNARGEGLGLGLSLVKRICAHEGWQISVHNRAAGGSCFRVSFSESV